MSILQKIGWSTPNMQERTRNALEAGRQVKALYEYVEKITEIFEKRIERLEKIEASKIRTRKSNK